ncbi:MAG: YybH family protein, partial [Candidatus Binataceae bacterium]
MTPEEELLARYFDAFNRHDLAGVLECFHAEPLIIDNAGARYAGREEVQRYYETSFALFPDARCDLR